MSTDNVGMVVVTLLLSITGFTTLLLVFSLRRLEGEFHDQKELIDEIIKKGEDEKVEKGK